MGIRERKPCWHCGSVDNQIWINEQSCFIVCNNCWSFGPNGMTNEEVEVMWNTRPNEIVGYCRDCTNWHKNACNLVPGDHYCKDFTPTKGE